MKGYSVTTTGTLIRAGAMIALLVLSACVGDTLTSRGGTAKMTVPGQPNVYIFRHQTPRTTVMVVVDTVDGPDARVNMGSMADKVLYAQNAALHYTKLRVCTNGAPELAPDMPAVYSELRNTWVVPVSCNT